jgi:hypothetical protein
MLFTPTIATLVALLTVQLSVTLAPLATEPLLFPVKELIYGSTGTAGVEDDLLLQPPATSTEIAPARTAEAITAWPCVSQPG